MVSLRLKGDEGGGVATPAGGLVPHFGLFVPRCPKICLGPFLARAARMSDRTRSRPSTGATNLPFTSTTMIGADRTGYRVPLAKSKSLRPFTSQSAASPAETHAKRFGHFLEARPASLSHAWTCGMRVALLTLRVPCPWRCRKRRHAHLASPPAPRCCKLVATLAITSMTAMIWTVMAW